MKLEQQIRHKLQGTFTPLVLDLINESHMHAVPADSETHFKLVLVSEQFAGQRRLARHRAINKCLAEELAGPVHALALHLYSPEEWAQRQQVPASPPCAGGGR